MFALHLRAVASTSRRAAFQSPWRRGWLRALIATSLALVLSLVSLPTAGAEESTTGEPVASAQADEPKAEASEEPKAEPSEEPTSEPKAEPSEEAKPDPKPEPSAEPKDPAPKAEPSEKPAPEPVKPTKSAPAERSTAGTASPAPTKTAQARTQNLTTETTPTPSPTVSEPTWLPLKVRKYVTASYERDYDWKITKQVTSDSPMSVRAGQNGEVDYSVTVTPTAGKDSNFRLTGSIWVVNPNPKAVKVTVSDDLRVAGGQCVLTNATNVMVPAATSGSQADWGQLQVPFACTMPASVNATSAGQNIGIVDWDEADLPGAISPTTGGSWARNYAAFDFSTATPTVTDGDVVVSDSAPEFASTFTQDQRTLHAADILASDSKSVTFTYSRMLGSTVLPGSCSTFDNTAVVAALSGNPALDRTGEDQVAGDLTASASVDVCAGYAPLKVRKYVTPSYDRDYDWKITKTVVGSATAQVAPGATAPFDYQLTVMPSGPQDSNFKLTGTIWAANPNAKPVPVTFSDDIRLAGASCTVTDPGNLVVPAATGTKPSEWGTVSVPVDCTMPAGTNATTAGINVGLIDWADEDLPGAVSPDTHGSWARSYAGFDFATATPTVTDQTIVVTDTAPEFAAAFTPAQRTLDAATLLASDTKSTSFLYTRHLGESVAAGQCVPFDNTATLTGAEGAPAPAREGDDQVAGDLTSSASVEVCAVQQWTDVGITKTHSSMEGTSVEPGQEFDYLLTVTNNGTNAATNVVVTDPVPSRLAVLGLTLPTGWTNANAPALVDADGKVSVSIPSLAVGASADITVHVKVTPLDQAPVATGGVSAMPELDGNALVNTACVAADMDSNPENNCASDHLETRDIAANVGVKCVADAAYLTFSVNTTANLKDLPITLNWMAVDGSGNPVPGADPADAGMSGVHRGEVYTLAWPGAGFGPGGVSTDWPGWRPLRASDYAPDGSNYYLPGTTTPMTAEQRQTHLFNGMILDDSELDYSWRFGSKVTFSVNPEISFNVAYPDASADCMVARSTKVEITKTASVTETVPGESFDYDLAVKNVAGNGAADGVVVTDPIPSHLKVDQVTTGASPSFPSWRSCEVTGTDADGYGGLLTCDLFGVLQPGQSAPAITLGVTVDPETDVTDIDNVAAVDYHLFGNPSDTGHDEDDATVHLLLAVLGEEPEAEEGTPTAVLAMTGSEGTTSLLGAALAAILAGSLLLLGRRRRHGDAS